ncbi:MULTISPECIES: isochorismatase family protein [Aminobacter]|jgi:nicotinamidase-related amidase|uniref:Isochorismatase n=1 Tax=Aminobacter aminovorans TaxID=83263 RepID=A0AAC8YJ89_AMIAI|nr:MULTISPECIES: isochorismatase family protein [Aminobacter]AMS39144.1 Isochorismatase [Aminobacter aminovorans]MBB3706975.1 nicotinamidase-related amidase [Aminobacter aminovorans]WMC97569.1 isochorismatase family protein [Aminobacter aminovorans]
MGEVPTVEALVIVDVQRAFVSGAEAVPDHLSLLSAVTLLLDQARLAGVPVIFIQNDGPLGAVDEPYTSGWQLHFPPRPGEHVVRKQADDGFVGTNLNDLLVAARVGTIAICGMLSEMCLATTARTAMATGYGVILPHDGHATYDVPPGPGGSEGVPAHLAARAAEWSLGDEVIIVASAGDVKFARHQAG